MKDRMHFLIAITVALSVLLIVAIRLLFRFSYDTFIPWDIGFGLFLYIVFFFCTIIASEVYFFNTKFSARKRLIYKTLPAVLNIIVIGFIINFFTFPDLGRNSDSGAAGLAIIFFIIAWVSITTTIFVILTYIRLDNPYDPIYKPEKHKKYLFANSIIGGFIQKNALITTPILIASISYIGFLTYSDFLAEGMEYSYTDKLNTRLMFKKSKSNFDISFCDYIKDVRSNYLKPYCYESFFEQVNEIKQFNDRNKQIPSTANFFKIFNKYRNGQCNHLKETTLCEDVLLRSTYEILVLNTEKLFSYASISVEKINNIPQYLIIRSRKEKAYKSINPLVVDEVKKHLSHSSAMFKNNMPDENKDSTIIHLDIKNLASNEKDFVTFSKEMKKIRKSLLNRYKIAEKVKKEKNKKLLEEKNLKHDKIFRKHFKLGPNDPITYEPCPEEHNTKYLTDSSDICINGIKIPNSGSKAPLLHRGSK